MSGPRAGSTSRPVFSLQRELPCHFWEKEIKNIKSKCCRTEVDSVLKLGYLIPMSTKVKVRLCCGFPTGFFFKVKWSQFSSRSWWIKLKKNCGKLSYGLNVETKAADGLFVENVKYTSSYTRLNQCSRLIVFGVWSEANTALDSEPRVNIFVFPQGAGVWLHVVNSYAAPWGVLVQGA